MPYILRKVKDGFKVCLKKEPSVCFSKKGLTKETAEKQMKAIAISEHKEGGKRETWAEARAREARQLEEFNKKNEAKKAKEHRRTAKEAKDAQLVRLTRELDEKKRQLAARMENRPAEREEMIKRYNEDIEKINNFDFYSLNNTRLRDALDAQYGQMLRNMGRDMYTYGELPDWVGRDIGKPEAIKYVYEHYGQAKPNFWDTFNDAVSFVGSMIPGAGTVFSVLDTIRGDVMEAVKEQPEDLVQVDYDIINQDIEKQLQDFDATLAEDEAEQQALAEEEAKLQHEREANQLVDTELSPEEIGQKAEEMRGFGKPANKKLYDAISKKVKKDQPKHSLFRSARIQKEYQDAGGTYIGDKPGDKKGLKGWFDAKWISMNDYAHDGEIVPCGNARTEERYGEYPLCRPLKVAKKIGRTKALKMLKAKDELKEQPLFTEKVLGTDRYNIRKEMAGGFHQLIGEAKPLTARLGGKVLLKKTIVDKFFPSASSYSTYVEPFVGGGSVYFYKEKDGHKEVVNDLDPLVYTLFKGFQKYPAEKIAKAVNGDYEKDDFLKIVSSKPSGDFENFIKQFLINRLSYFAKSKAFGKPRISASFEGYQDRLKDATILKKDWKQVIKKYNEEKDVFFYLDPPMAKSDSLFDYDQVNLDDLKKAVDAIDDAGNKFLLSMTEEGKDKFKAYDVHKIKTTYVGDRRRGGQTVPIYEYLITNYHVGTSGSGKPGTLGKSDEKKQLERGEKSSDAFMKQLEKLRIAPDEYLTVAKHLAKSKGYDPSKLSFASDGEHKLLYDSPQGLRKFGRVGYGDFIIWSYLERMGKVPEGTAKKKREVFHKSHRAMSKEYGLTKYTPNELALNINW
jgi:site-specific DNA-adenine methylase